MTVSPEESSRPNSGELHATGRRIGINALWLTLQPLLVNLTSIPVLAYTTRVLGEEGYGRFTLALATAVMTTTIASLGTAPVAVREMAKDRLRSPEYLGRLIRVRAALCLPASAAALLIAWLPASGFGAESRQALYILLATQAVTSIAAAFGNYFHAHERMQLYARSQFHMGLWLNVASVLFLWLGWGLPGLCLAYVVGAVVLLICSLLYARELPPPKFGMDGAFLRRLYAQSAPFAGNTALRNVGNRLDLYFAANLFGEAGVGVYGAASQLVGRLVVIPDGLSTSLYPALSAVVDRQRELAAQLVRRSLLATILITTPLAIFISLLAPHIVELLFGARFHASVGILQLLVWMLPGIAIQRVAASGLNALGCPGLNTWALGVSQAAGFATMLYLAPRVGLWGLGAGVLVREGIGSVMRLILIHWRLRGSLAATELLRAALVLALVAGGAAWASAQAAPVAFAASALLACLFYPTLLWKSGLVTPSQLRLLLRPAPPAAGGEP